MARIQVVTGDQARADSLRKMLSESGHGVQAGCMHETVREKMSKTPPDAVIIDLERAPATGRDLGLYLRVQKATRLCVLVFLDGKPAKVKAICELIPDAIYTTLDSLVDAVKNGLANPPTDPHVPDSVFAGYAGRPLAAKLGIRAGMQVALVDAPESVLGVLNPLPDRVEFRHDLNETPDIALWFTPMKRNLQQSLPSILAGVRDGKLWILWPKKSSGIESDLTQQIVRQQGLEAGWVDFKVCAFNETWSGLCFTARKNK